MKITIFKNCDIYIYYNTYNVSLVYYLRLCYLVMVCVSKELETAKTRKYFASAFVMSECYSNAESL